MVSPTEGPRQPVLVTGVDGFTGAYVREELIGAGYDVIGTCLHTGPSARVLDIASIDQCRVLMDELRPRYIVHLAASSFVADEDALDMYRVNVLGTINLLQACSDVGHQPDKVVIASSASVYGNRAGTIDESVTPEPVSHYGASKAAMEHLVRTWFERLPIVVTRPFNYTGCGQSGRFLVPKIVSSFVQQRPYIELGNLEVARDFSDVRTVAKIYRALMESPVASEIVNVCSEAAYTLRQILEMVRAASGHDLEVRVNRSLIRANEVRVLVGSAGKLRDLVGNVPSYQFSETIDWMVGYASTQAKAAGHASGGEERPAL